MENFDREWETQSIDVFVERTKKALFIGIFTTVSLIGIGVLGYHFIEGMDLFSALYMTIITIATVGFSEVKPLSTYGRIFTMFIILGGTGTFFYFATVLLSIISQGGVFVLLDHYRRQRRMKKLESHIIVCGYGRVGENICEELLLEGVPFVVIEKNVNRIKLLAKRKILFVSGLANEETLRAAGIEKARSIILALGDDVENLFVALTARELNPSIFIVSRLNDPTNEEKFIRIGVDRVVMPYRVGAARMAQCAIRPAVTSLIDVIASKKGLDILVEEIEIKKDSWICGKSLIELDLRRRYGLIVVAILKGGKDLIQADPEVVMEEGDILIILGNKSSITKFVDDIRSGLT